MSTPAQVTEAHHQLALAINGDDSEFAWLDAQLIADSEARATAELRTVFPQICAALGNGAFCTPDVSVEFIKAIPNEVAEVVAQLRDEVEAQCLLNGKGAEREASLLGQLERSAREIEQKRNLLTVAIKSAGDQATRANEAEAELADIRALANRRNKRDHSQDTTHQLVAALDQALDIAQAELAEQQWLKESALKRAKELTAELAQFRELDAERARLDWLESDAGMEFQWETTTVITRAAIDAAMKEETK